MDREYQLVVEGELSDRAAQAFTGMSLARSNGRTTLSGPVRDQSEPSRSFNASRPWA